MVVKAERLPAAEAQQLVADWFERYQLPIFRYLLRLVGDRERASDLLQDTFVKALTALAAQPPPLHAQAWLYRIAGNIAFNAIRRQRRWRWLPLLGHEPVPAFEPGVATAQDVRDCLARMRPADAELLLLYEYAGLSSAEIGALTGESAAVVRVRVSRACKQFCKLYKKELG